jgi:hypothetical protein
VPCAELKIAFTILRTINAHEKDILPCPGTHTVAKEAAADGEVDGDAVKVTGYEKVGDGVTEPL